MTGSEKLKELEKHCGENLTCSKRLRFQIESTIDRMLNEKVIMAANIKNVLDGFQTFDPQTQKAIYRSK